MKKRPLLVDALVGLSLTLFVAGSAFLQAGFLESLELKAFDLRSRLRQSVDAGGRDIAIIAIDDDSIARLGRWPWSRARIADMLDLLAKAHPKVIGLDVLFSEPEANDGLSELDRLRSEYQTLVRGRKIREARGVSFASEFSSAAVRLDTDARLLQSIAAAGNVVLPMYFATSGTIGAKPAPLPPAISSGALSGQPASAADAAVALEGTQATVPVLAFAEKAMGVGHVNVFPDFDGVVRRESPAIVYGGRYYPSYALELVLCYLGLRPADAVVSADHLSLGKLRVPLDETQSMLVSFNGGYQTFRYYSFHEVLGGKVSMDLFKDKIVLIGPSAAGVSTLYVTPVAHNLPAVEVVANVVDNMLRQKYLVRPPWAARAEYGLIALVGLFIMLLLPRLRAATGAALTVLLLAALVAGGTDLFVRGQWVKVGYPAFLLLVGYVVLMTRRFIFTERGKELVEASAIETNRMLGLSFQGQGMLDLAFDKFRLCPVDDQLKDLLYNLALDFERKRQYNKAVAVYEHVAAADKGYKDIQDKMKVLRQAADGAVFGSIGGASKEGTVTIAEGSEKPKLGRYEIEKELGRGAMGVVYLGRDPKINRKVAIKTMMLEEGADAAAAKEIKERFFREAESAGTLNHPSIVRIFDAGEEQDIAYIAMELLDGQDLAGFTQPGHLLPVETVLEYAATVADALDYAHQQGIVHRDIKPANVMLLRDGTIRVADFGIARITASSKTATGTVMGTPSYMSPEQVAGKKVDGRSDLFSLGVALFEFVTGQKPFPGGEGIGTLLFQIANDPEPEPAALNPSLPPCVSAVIHRALKKDPEERYQRGSEMASDLRGCLAAMKQGGTTPSAEAATQPIPAGVLAPPEPAVASAGAETAEEIAASIRMPAAGATQPVSIDPAATVPAGKIDPLLAAAAASLDDTLRAGGPLPPEAPGGTGRSS